MKRITGFSVLCLMAVLFGGAAWAVDGEPSNLPVLATNAYVELAYDSLDAKKQDKLSSGNNIKIEDGTVSLDFSDVQNVADGTYVLTATKGPNNQITLKWEDITRSAIRNGDM